MIFSPFKTGTRLGDFSPMAIEGVIMGDIEGDIIGERLGEKFGDILGEYPAPGLRFFGSIGMGCIAGGASIGAPIIP